MGESSLVAQRASKSTQFFYGFGSISVGIKNNLLGSFLLIYYNQVLGMDAMTVSIAFFIALMIDAISDPLIGIWSDRTQTKYGRRHPFLYFSITLNLLTFIDGVIISFSIVNSSSIST